MAKDTVSSVRGRVTLWRVEDSGLMVPVHTQHNQIQFYWGFLAAKQLGYRPAAGRPSFHISGMYVEFENVGLPEDPVTIASEFGRDVGINYYDDLLASSTQDFLRVPLRLEPSLGISTGYEDYFTAGETGNQLTFFSQTAGSSGVHGKTFSHAVNSKIFAAALIATPEFADRTKDVVFARTVFDINDQVTKEASSQIGITWDVAFE